MEMHKEKYEELLLRFAKEIHEVGVTENIKKIVESQFTRTPNLSNPHAEETVRKFYYQYDGYCIEATQVVGLKLKKIKP